VEWIPIFFGGFSGIYSLRWNQKLILPMERYACCFAAIKHEKFYKDLKKLLSSHPKDFAVRQKLAEIFIVQHDFTGKMNQPSSVTNFRALQYSQTHSGKT